MSHGEKKLKSQQYFCFFLCFLFAFACQKTIISNNIIKVHTHVSIFMTLDILRRFYLVPLCPCTFNDNNTLG